MSHLAPGYLGIPRAQLVCSLYREETEHREVSDLSQINLNPGSSDSKIFALDH